VILARSREGLSGTLRRPRDPSRAIFRFRRSDRLFIFCPTFCQASHIRVRQRIAGNYHSRVYGARRPHRADAERFTPEPGHGADGKRRKGEDHVFRTSEARLRIRCARTVHRRPYDGNPSFETSRGVHQQPERRARQAPELKGRAIEQILADLTKVPEDIRTAVRNHGGGFFNHNGLLVDHGSKAGGEPKGPLSDAIKSVFGGFAAFKEKFSAAAASQFGSGWAWLSVKDGALVVSSTPNQDSPVSQGMTPILTIDVWEHAYYLKYQNRRPEYIENWWHAINWNEASRRFEAAK